MDTRPTRLCTVLALAAVGLSAASAQSNTTALSGTVMDSTGAIMPGVPISLTNKDTGTTVSTVTKSKGEYSFQQLVPGHYAVDVKAGKGFSEREEDVELLISTPLSLNFRLTVGSTEIVNVESSIAALNSSDATLGKAFDSHQIATLPYLANNITYLLSLQPGVLGLDSGAKTGGLNTDNRTGIVNGARQDQTNVTLDGVDNNDQTNGYAFNGALRSTRESVEEFRVTTSNANADAGRSSGAQVSLETRSGTNTMHGSAYEYYRSTLGASNDWFTKQSQLNVGKPNIPSKILQHTYGASLGLPIIKDKFFFFGAYEGFKQASDIGVTETVPSLLGGGGLVTGNVSYLGCPDVGGLVVRNCAATAAVTKTLSRAEIGTLYAPSKDAACATPGACHAPATNDALLAYFAKFPAANSSSGGDGLNTGSYLFSSPSPLHQITNIARLDYRINGKQTVFVRGNLQSDNQATALSFPGGSPNAQLYSNNRGIAAGHIWNISNSLINNFRYGMVRQGAATRGAGSQPFTSISAISPLTGTATSSVDIVTTNNFADDITLVKGRHIIQAGVNDRILRNSRSFDANLQAVAYINPNLLAVAGIANKQGTLDPSQFDGSAGCPDCLGVTPSFRTFYNTAILADTGIIEEADSGVNYVVAGNQLVPVAGIPTHTYHNLEQEYYLQDQWKATSRLTLTAGVRYVYLSTPYEINGQQIAPTASLNTVNQQRIKSAAGGNVFSDRVAFQASGSANGAPNFWTPQRLNFAPRVAFAYTTPDNKTSIHGGFALAYDHIGEGIIDQYESSGSSLFSLSQTNITPYTDVNTGPTFTSYGALPAGAVPGATATPLPFTPGDNPFSFLNSINSVIKTPYGETFNLSLQQDFGHNMVMTMSYVGRLGRHLLANLDVVQPTNLYDPISGQSYFDAATAFDKLIDAGTPVSLIPDSGYFHNIFPNATYSGGLTGAKAYYEYLANGDRGNETDPLFAYDTDPTASAAGQSFRFFYPQTSSIFAQSTIGNSSYHALQVSMRQALKYGLVYDFNYTWSKSEDQGSSPERTSANFIINTFNPRGNHSVSDFDVRHNITLDYSAPLPFGRGALFLSNSNKLVDALIGGWQVNGVGHYSTGFPYSATVNGNYGTNFAVTSYFVQTGPIPTGGHHYDPVHRVETSLKGITPAQAFANLRYPYAGETGQRNNFRADGYFSLDDSVSKSFHTYREQQFKIGVDVFNILNTNRFNSLAMTTNGASTKFGQYLGNVTSASGVVTANGLLTSPRQMQFSGKYVF